MVFCCDSPCEYGIQSVTLTTGVRPRRVQMKNRCSESTPNLPPVPQKKKGKGKRKGRRGKRKEYLLGIWVWVVCFRTIPGNSRSFTGATTQRTLAQDIWLPFYPSMAGSLHSTLHPPPRNSPDAAPAQPNPPPVKSSEESSALSARKCTLGGSETICHVPVISDQ